MIDLRSWPKKWNDASLRQIATLPEDSSGGWSLLGMFAVGVVAGALGSYAMTQRSRIRRLALRAMDGMDDELSQVVAKPASVSASSSNHRRKATAKVR